MKTNYIKEEIEEITAECKQNFKDCKVYGLDLNEKPHTQIGYMQYMPMHWTEMTADQLDVFILQLEEMKTQLDKTIEGLSALSYAKERLDKGE